VGSQSEWKKTQCSHNKIERMYYRYSLFRSIAMRHLFSVLIFALAVLLGACTNNPTTPAATMGEIYGYVQISNEYGAQLTDQSGLTVQILANGKILQSTSTAKDGLYSFKDVPAGVYDFRWFKVGYVCTGLASSPDTSTLMNIQFVGNGRFLLDQNNHGYRYFDFYSTAEPDTTYWEIKPELRYEIIRDIKVVNDIWIKDTVAYDSNSHHDPVYKSVFGSGTKETQSIRFIVDFQKLLPFPTMKRTVSFSKKYNTGNWDNYIPKVTSDGNVLTTEYVYSIPNIIVKDSLGTIVENHGRGSYSNIPIKQITVQASSTILNAVKQRFELEKYYKSKELTVKLID
jgi:hypothetical protein